MGAAALRAGKPLAVSGKNVFEVFGFYTFSFMRKSLNIIKKVNADVRKIVSDPKFQKRYLEHFAVQPMPGPLDAFAEYLREDSAKWGEVRQQRFHRQLAGRQKRQGQNRLPGLILYDHHQGPYRGVALFPQFADGLLGIRKCRPNIRQVRAVRIILDPFPAACREEISRHRTPPPCHALA